MKNSFWGLIWSSFLEIQGVLVGFLGVGVSIAAWVISSKTQISLALVITIGVFTLIVLITLLQAVYQAFRHTKKLESDLEKEKESHQNLAQELNKLKIPRILRVGKKQGSGSITCLFDNSDLFASQQMISFFYIDEYGFEALIGVGSITNIQSNHKIQAVIEQIDPAYQDILDRLVSNDAVVLEKTKVRPGIPKNFYNFYKP